MKQKWRDTVEWSLKGVVVADLMLMSFGYTIDDIKLSMPLNRKWKRLAVFPDCDEGGDPSPYDEYSVFVWPIFF